MNSLEGIKSSLESNVNLNDDIKSKFIELITVFHKKLPEVDLSRLSEKLKTVKFNRMSKFERIGVYKYDLVNNEILFTANLKDNYDIDHLLMKAILEMASSTNSFTGFNSDERLKTLNLAYTEILSNFIVGNEGDSDLEEEMLITNLLSHIIGKEAMFNSYFTNDGDTIIKAMQDAEVGML